MIIHTSDSHQIPSQNKTKSKLRILRNCQKFKFEILQKTFHITHLLKLLDKMYKHEVDPTRTLGATELKRDVGRTDEQTDGVKPIYPPTTSLCLGYNEFCLICNKSKSKQPETIHKWKQENYITSQSGIEGLSNVIQPREITGKYLLLLNINTW